MDSRVLESTSLLLSACTPLHLYATTQSLTSSQDLLLSTCSRTALPLKESGAPNRNAELQGVSGCHHSGATQGTPLMQPRVLFTSTKKICPEHWKYSRNRADR